MFNTMSKDTQVKLREKFFKEHDEKVKEYGLDPTVTGPYALIKMIEPEDITSGGIYIPPDPRDQEAMYIGMVIDIGPTALCGFGLPGEQVTMGPKDYGLAVGNFVQFDCYEGSLCAYPQFNTYRVIPAENIKLVYKEQS